MTHPKRKCDEMEEESSDESDCSPAVKKFCQECKDPQQDSDADSEEDLSGYLSDDSEIVALTSRVHQKITLSNQDRTRHAESLMKRRLDSSSSSSSESSSSSVGTEFEGMETESTFKLLSE